MGKKILSISLMLNFTPITFDCYGLVALRKGSPQMMVILSLLTTVSSLYVPRPFFPLLSFIVVVFFSSSMYLSKAVINSF